MEQTQPSSVTQKNLKDKTLIFYFPDSVLQPYTKYSLIALGRST